MISLKWLIFSRLIFNADLSYNGLFSLIRYVNVCLGFPRSSAGKESTCNAGDLRLIPGMGRCSGEGKGYPLQYSGLANSMDCIVHGVTKSQTQLSDFSLLYFPEVSFLFHLGYFPIPLSKPFCLRSLSHSLK